MHTENVLSLSDRLQVVVIVALLVSSLRQILSQISKNEPTQVFKSSEHKALN